MKKRFNKVLTLVTALAVALCCYPANFVMAEEADEAHGVIYPVGGRVDSGKEIPASRGEEDGMLGVPSAYPKSYDATDLIASLNLPKVRNQNPWGTCWAHGTIAAVESAALRNESIKIAGSRPTKDKIDLSEWALAYYMYNIAGEYPRSYDTSEIKNLSKEDDADVMSSWAAIGGFSDVALKFLMSWAGAANQLEDYPTKLKPAAESKFSDDAVHLSGYKAYNILENPELVKKAITENGVATFLYYVDFDFKYNNLLNHTYYYNGEKKDGNHVVAVVGWDDNFPKEKFSQYYYSKIENGVDKAISEEDFAKLNDEEKAAYVVGEETEPTVRKPVEPAKNGAWLLRNSWGESYGQDGYFWISYYDTGICPESDVAYVNNIDDYDEIYQYDNQADDDVFEANTDSVSVSNIYYAEGDPDGMCASESIEAVAFATGSTDLNYSVSIYGFAPEYNSLYNVPDRGYPLTDAPITGKTDAIGYYQVKLDKPITVPVGTKFAVVVSMKSSDGSVVLLPRERISCTTTNYKDGDSKYPYEEILNTEANLGESWIYNYNNLGQWADVNGLTNEGERSNFRIKAYTNYIEKECDPIPTPEITFTDVPDNKWYSDSVRFMVLNGIMSGTSATTFEPDKKCDRAMMVTILNNMAYKDTADITLPFKDVAEGKWYTQPIKWAYNCNVSKGVSKTKFGIKDELTREQVACFLYNYAKACKWDMSNAGDLSKYKDAKDISAWAKEAMKWANYYGIINGVSAHHLNPKGTASRAEVARMVDSYIGIYSDYD